MLFLAGTVRRTDRPRVCSLVSRVIYETVVGTWNLSLGDGLVETNRCSVYISRAVLPGTPAAALGVYNTRVRGCPLPRTVPRTHERTDPRVVDLKSGSMSRTAGHAQWSRARTARAASDQHTDFCLCPMGQQLALVSCLINKFRPSGCAPR